MKNTILSLLILLAFVISSVTNAQTQQVKKRLQKQEETTFFSIQKSFNDYWAPYNVKNGYYTENGIKKKAAGWKQFRRWEWYWNVRVDPTTGRFPTISAADVRKQMFRPPNNGAMAATGNWTSMGPSSTTGGYAGLGRLNCVAFRSGDNNTIYTGSPSGVLWKTTDGGSNWPSLTDANDVLGVSDAIVIAGATPATDIVYIGTGDRDGGSMWTLGGGQSNDNNSIGVLKSTDGGTTWATTGLTFTASQKRTINRMLVNPTDNTMLYAATSVGLYQTTDAGVNWSQLVATEYVDIKYKPGDNQTMYGSTRTGKIYRSTNAGTTWTNTIDTYAAGGRRVDIAVSANQPTWVYAIITNSSGALHGIYKSTDSGASFSLVYNGTNLLGWNCDGSGTTGQGNYDLCIASDPNDANVVFIGGVNTWKSSDGGSTWSITNVWSGNCGGTATEVHADKHFLAFQDGTSTLFECNDGGLYKTSNGGTTWSHVGNGLVISQMYRLGVAQTVSNDVIAGLQDNGTKAMLGGTWSDVIGGDGMECAIDYTNENTQYGELYYGDLKRTTNHWASYSTITTGLTGNAWWVMPFVLDPNVNTTIYAGLQDVFKSTNQGTSWTKISSWAGSSLRSLAVAPSNSSYIYAATQTILYRTTDGGSSWSNITGALPVGSSSITYITVKDDDPNTVWVSMGQYNSDGVYQTTDGGTTWTNISAGLPTIPVMCVVQNTQNTAQVELYAGTDVGVYVKVGGTNWALFSTGLPNVVVNELEIYYNSGTPSLSRIRAATSGRGLWESELYSPPNSPPVADFTADATSPGVGQTVTFTDQSSNVPTSWSWVFTPSTVSFVGGTSETPQNPQVQFNATGNYTVQLTATNAYGSDINNKTDYISVSSLLSYCAAGAGTTFEYISNVQLGTINNSSGSSGYADYTGISTDLTINQTYNITVSNGQIDTNDD
ncbi:MAG: PKD domain-containing protein, partial [Bacteroidales bacterium]|nr:PKD domain-containing protein [Bacteroidales bacterium]